MTTQDNIKQEIQGSRLGDNETNKSWQYLTWGGLIVVVIALLIAPQMVSNYFLFVLSLWAITTIAAQIRSMKTRVGKFENLVLAVVDSIEKHLRPTSVQRRLPHA